MNVRRFNEAGMAAARGFLAGCRQDPTSNVPPLLLEDSVLSDEVEPFITVKPRQFDTKADAATYFCELLVPLSDHGVAEDAGLWTWLSLYFFDEVCPLKNGRRSVKNDYTYIFEPKNSRHFYRHLLFIAWWVFKVSGDYHRLFSCGRLDKLDKVTTEVMKRLYLTRIPSIFEVLDRLYWDEARSRPRGGITRPVVKRGDLVHRLPIRIRQLEMTYDLQSITADQLIELLGAEFDFEREQAAAAPV